MKATTQLPNQSLKCITKKHAATCLREAVAKLIQPLSGKNFLLHQENPNCWNPCELISDYMVAVNLSNEFFSPNTEKRKTLKDGTVVCAWETELTINLEIYAIGCKTTKDTALMVMAQIIPLLIPDMGYPLIPYVRGANHGSAVFSSNFDYDTERTRLTIPINLHFDYVPSMPSLLFNRS